MYDRFTPLLCAAVLFLTGIGGTARAQCADVPPNPKDDVEEAAFGSACAMNAAGTVALVSGPGFDLGDGVVRTFERINGDWVEGTALGAQQLLGENYGWGLAMSDDGSAAIITAPRESVFSPGFRLAAGGVYIFQRDPDTGIWSQVRKWNSPDPNTEYNFGASCDMSADGGTVVIGETNVLGSKQAGLPDAGYVATRVGGVWGEPIELIPSPAPPDTFQFGEQVRISDDATLIAVSAASPPAFTGQSGRVYIFELIGDTWTQTDMLERATADSFNSFGKAIGFDGHDLLASNPSEMTPASKFDPTPPICIYRRSGGAYPATPDEIMTYATGTPIAGGFIVRGDTLVATDSRFNFFYAHGLVRYRRDTGNPGRTWKFDALFTSEASQDFGPTGYGMAAAFADDPETLVVGEPGWTSDFTSSRIGRINFPDRVFTQGEFEIAQGSSFMNLQFDFPGNGTQFFSVQLLGSFDLVYPQNCTGDQAPPQVVLHEMSVTMVPDELVLQGPLGVPMTISQPRLSLAMPADPVPVDSGGGVTFDHLMVHFDAMLRVGNLPAVPLSFDAAQEQPVWALVGGGFGQPLSLSASDIAVEIFADLGLGDLNPVVHAQGSVYSQLVEPGCDADLTGDGMLNFFDISAFLSAFASQDPVADFNGDGSFNFFDVSAFLSAFGLGCP